MSGNESGERERKETVTVCFLSNHDVDPDEFDLRVKKPDKIRKQLKKAAASRGRIQDVAEHHDDGLERYRRLIKEARERNDRSPHTGSQREAGDS